MTVKIVYNEDCQPLQNRITAHLWQNFPKIQVETYDESHYKDKKKAIMIKASCGTRLAPFVAIYDDSKELIKAFYSETGDCTFDNIIKYLNDI
jgi:hypothetical protein